MIGLVIGQEQNGQKMIVLYKHTLFIINSSWLKKINSQIYFLKYMVSQLNKIASTARASSTGTGGYKVDIIKICSFLCIVSQRVTL